MSLLALSNMFLRITRGIKMESRENSRLFISVCVCWMASAFSSAVTAPAGVELYLASMSAREVLTISISSNIPSTLLSRSRFSKVPVQPLWVVRFPTVWFVLVKTDTALYAFLTLSQASSAKRIVSYIALPSPATSVVTNLDSPRSATAFSSRAKLASPLSDKSSFGKGRWVISTGALSPAFLTRTSCPGKKSPRSSTLLEEERRPSLQTAAIARMVRKANMILDSNNSGDSTAT